MRAEVPGRALWQRSQREPAPYAARAGFQVMGLICLPAWRAFPTTNHTEPQLPRLVFAIGVQSSTNAWCSDECVANGHPSGTEVLPRRSADVATGYPGLFPPAAEAMH